MAAQERQLQQVFDQNGVVHHPRQAIADLGSDRAVQLGEGRLVAVDVARHRSVEPACGRLAATTLARPRAGEAEIDCGGVGGLGGRLHGASFGV